MSPKAVIARRPRSSVQEQVAAVRDDPAARLALMARLFHGPTGRAPRDLPFRRAALSFMRWQARRGVLNPLDASPPGSVWWRAVNERLLRDGCETVALLGGLAGEPSSQAVRLWLDGLLLAAIGTMYVGACVAFLAYFHGDHAGRVCFVINRARTAKAHA